MDPRLNSNPTGGDRAVVIKLSQQLLQSHTCDEMASLPQRTVHSHTGNEAAVVYSVPTVYASYLHGRSHHI